MTDDCVVAMGWALMASKEPIRVGIINGIDFDQRLNAAKFRLRAEINRLRWNIESEARVKEGLYIIKAAIEVVPYEGATSYGIMWPDEIGLWPHERVTRMKKPLRFTPRPPKTGNEETGEQDQDGDE